MARTISYQVGVLGLGRIIAYLVMFCVPIVNVRALSVHDYGIYRQFWLLFETIAAVLVMAFPNSLLYYFPRAGDKKAKTVYLTQTLVYLMFAGLASCVVYGLLHVILGEGLGGVVKQFFWRLCFFSLFMIVSQCMDRLFIAERQVERQSIYHVSASALQAIVIVLVSWFTRSVELLVWALLAVAAAKFAVTVLYVGAQYRPSLRSISRRSMKDQLSYAIPLGLAAVVLTLFAQTDKYIITHYMGAGAFAVYSIGAMQLPFVDLIRSSITNVTFPLMAEYQKEERYDEILGLWRRATLRTAVLFFPIFVFLEIAAKPFITILFRETYAAAVPVFMIYLLLFLRSTIETGSVIMVFKKNAFLFKVNVIAFVANVILSVAMYKQFGRLGVPFATVIVAYLMNALNVVKAGQLLDVPVLKLMPWLGLLKRLGVALVPGVLLYLVYQRIVVDDVIELAVTGMAYFGVYLAAAFGLRYITVREIRAMFGKTG